MGKLTSKQKLEYLGLIRKTFIELDNLYGTNATNVQVNISSRMTKCLGQYTFGSRSINPIKFTFSEDLYLRFPIEEVIDTIKHEYAHYYVNSKYKRDDGHGNYWKNFMIELGLNPNRCKSSSLEIKPRKFKYDVVCNCCGEVVVRRDVLRSSLLTNYRSSCCKSKLVAKKNF